MSKEIEPQMTTRASAYEFWMNAPNPMVTFFKTLDVTNLVRVGRKKGYKFNMLLDYCIGKAAAPIKEFYMLPVEGRLIKYDTLAVNTIVKNREGEVSSCDILFADDLIVFNSEYLTYTSRVADSCCDWDLSEDSMVIGTSAIIDIEIDGAVGKSRFFDILSYLGDISGRHVKEDLVPYRPPQSERKYDHSEYEQFK